MSDEPAELPRTLHDALFKKIFGDPRHAAAELRAVLPPRVARHIDWATLEAGQASMVGKRLQQRYGDLLFRARLFGGHDAMIWVIFEHQSTVKRWMPLRMVRLSEVLWDRWRKHNAGVKRLPAIIPVVLYQGPRPWNGPTSLGELLDVSEEIRQDLEGLGVSCRFVLDDLSALDDDDLAGRDMEPYPKLGLVVFKYGSEQELPERLARYSREIRALMATEHGPVQWGELVGYTWHVNPYIDRDEFIEQLRPIVSQEGERTMQTLADKLRAEGRQQGIQQGIQEGRQEGHRAGLSQGQRAILRQQLARRFGALPPAAEERVARADNAELQRWALRVLDAATLDEVFAPPE